MNNGQTVKKPMTDTVYTNEDAEREDSDTWAGWTDALGQPYGPGDMIAVATISGRSPQMVIAQVIEIRRKDASGNLIMEHGYGEVEDDNGTVRRQWGVTPSCKVKARPIVDGRQFSRSTRNPRPVTYSITGNIVKLQMGGLFGGDTEQPAVNSTS